MGVRPPSPRIAVFASLVAGVALALPALALGSAARATSAPWGQWHNVDPYTAAKVLSVCPTQSACGGSAGQQQLQVMVNGYPARGLRGVQGIRNRFGTTTSVSVPVSLIPQLAASPGVRAVRVDDSVHGTGSIAGISFPSLATLWPLVDNVPAAWAQG